MYMYIDIILGHDDQLVCFCLFVFNLIYTYVHINHYVQQPHIVHSYAQVVHTCV